MTRDMGWVTCHVITLHYLFEYLIIYLNFYVLVLFANMYESSRVPGYHDPGKKKLFITPDNVLRVACHQLDINVSTLVWKVEEATERMICSYQWNYNLSHILNNPF